MFELSQKKKRKWIKIIQLL